MVKRTSARFAYSSRILSTQNITFGILGILGTTVAYMYYYVMYGLPERLEQSSKTPTNRTTARENQVFAESIERSKNTPSIHTEKDDISLNVNVSTDPRTEMSNPYMPPLKTEIPPLLAVGVGGTHVVSNHIESSHRGSSRPNGSGCAIPVNISTSVIETPYTQVGILTNKHVTGMSDHLILPLMGRNLWNGRDKWMYYTMTNTNGSINTKLPIRVNGKSGTGEYGCDSISSGDVVYVEGYDDTFRATIYENAVLRYLPI